MFTQHQVVSVNGVLHLSLIHICSQNVPFDNVDAAVGAGLQIRLFGKPEIDGTRRLGVVLATAESVEEAVDRAKNAASQVKVTG